ncbi:MAG: retroviral-like aspartic protease family protein [Candidatus Azobacteroides sp.]|nr:retroviral-like aspartic protease family protein [Candidatus Azobacteroides sp.]
MKRYFVLFFVILTGINEVITAQEADEKIGYLINQADWFALANEYPKLKEEIQSEMLRHLSEAMIGYYFNQPQQAIQAIDWLLTNAQNEIGFENISNLILIKSIILGEQGLYAESADNLSNFLTQISEFADSKEFPVHNETLDFYKKMRNEPRPEVIRPDKNIEIPITINETDRGQTINVPVNIREKEYQFIFDTGSEYTFVSERFADEMKLRITQESFNINGIKSNVGKRGTIDSIRVGDIVFKNPNIIIGLPNESVDTIFQIDAILGMDFMKRVSEIQIYPEEKEIVFPVEKTKLPLYGCNLMLAYGQPYLQAYSNKEKLLLHFDTGNVKTDLYAVYYEKHKKEFEEEGNKKTVCRGGYGGTVFVDSYQISKFPLIVGNCGFELTHVDVLLDKTLSFQRHEDGSLGMDFISLFKKVIINFDNMFIKAEK